MTAQLIITMTSEFAARVGASRQRVNADKLFGDLRTAQLIGPVGYSMRVSIEEFEIPALKTLLGKRFVVEPDYAMETFSAPRRRTARAGSAAARG